MLHSNSSFFIFSSSFKLNVGDTHNVSEYSGSRYSGTGAVSLNHHRIFFIAFRSQQDDVVAAFQSVERMVGTHFLKSDRSFSVFQFGYKTPMLMFFLQYLTTGFKVCIETRHPFPEVIQRTFAILMVRLKGMSALILLKI